MRPALLLAPLLALACSGREPPGIRTFDAGWSNLVDAVMLPSDSGSVGTGDVARADVVLVPNGAVVPEFSLPDLNPASRTYQMNVSPQGLRPRLAVYYFGNAI